MAFPCLSSFMPVSMPLAQYVTHVLHNTVNNVLFLLTKNKVCPLSCARSNSLARVVCQAFSQRLYFIWLKTFTEGTVMWCRLVVNSLKIGSGNRARD